MIYDALALCLVAGSSAQCDGTSWPSLELGPGLQQLRSRAHERLQLRKHAEVFPPDRAAVAAARCMTIVGAVIAVGGTAGAHIGVTGVGGACAMAIDAWPEASDAGLALCLNDGLGEGSGGAIGSSSSTKRSGGKGREAAHEAMTPHTVVQNLARARDIQIVRRPAAVAHRRRRRTRHVVRRSDRHARKAAHEAMAGAAVVHAVADGGLAEVIGRPAAVRSRRPLSAGGDD